MKLCKSLGHNKGNQNNAYNNLLKVQKTTHQGETIAELQAQSKLWHGKLQKWD